MKKLLVVVLAVVLVFAFTSTAFASTLWFPGKSIYGGPSQWLEQEIQRDEEYSIHMSIEQINLNGNKSFQYRGYEHQGSYCTYIENVYGIGPANAWYIDPFDPDCVDVKVSISSTDPSDWAWFRGYVYV